MKYLHKIFHGRIAGTPQKQPQPGKTQVENSAGVNPVMLPAGLAMLVTNPFSTGSAIWTKTIGMLWVNCCKGATVSEDSPTMTLGLLPY